MALEGTLSYFDITHLFQVVGGARKSGVLEISWEERRAKVLFERGRLVVGIEAGFLAEEGIEREKAARGAPANGLETFLAALEGLAAATAEQLPAAHGDELS